MILLKKILKYAAQIILISVLIVAVISVLAILLGSISVGYFYTGYVFRASLVTGVVILAMGILTLIKPIGLKKEKLLDHSNYAQVVYERREEQRKRAVEILLLGSIITIIAGFLELLLMDVGA